METFKGDDLELQMIASGQAALSIISLELDAFTDGIYECVPLGEFLYDEDRVPLTNAIRRDIFADSFSQIFDSWKHCGTFEAYILVLQKIFGSDVIIEFTVPDPGVLQIDVESTGFQEDQFVAREIVDNAYVFYDMVTQDDDNLVFNVVKGFQTQQVLEAALFFLVPTGIYTEVSLTIGA